MGDMRLVVAGAAGRMGRVLVEIIRQTPGAHLSGAIEQPDSIAIGQDAGLLAGCGQMGVPISGDALATVAGADGILDFTTPSSTVGLAALAAQARIVHVIGTTGLDADHFSRLEAAARHAVVVRSGNMSLGVNLLAALVERAARTLGPEYDIEIVEMHHRMKVDAPSGTALLLGEAAATGRGVKLEQHSVRARDGHIGPR
ncbi:MAG: 4-hydroxy-tetrahydrodipicolinate reductase, partial [Methylocella sp.]